MDMMSSTRVPSLLMGICEGVPFGDVAMLPTGLTMLNVSLRIFMRKIIEKMRAAEKDSFFRNVIGCFLRPFI
jgi:hypothetical protein